MNQLFGVHGLNWKTESLLAECSRRMNGIYDKAMFDASAVFCYRGLQTDETAVSEIMRPELMKEIDFTNQEKVPGNRYFDEETGSVLNQLINEYNPGNSDSIVCRVTGDSMTDENIFNNDILVVDTNAGDFKGKIIVASISGILFVKRLAENQGRFHLYSANEKYKPVPVDELPDFKIVGAVRSVIHQVN